MSPTWTWKVKETKYFCHFKWVKFQTSSVVTVFFKINLKHMILLDSDSRCTFNLNRFGRLLNLHHNITVQSYDCDWTNAQSRNLSQIQPFQRRNFFYKIGYTAKYIWYDIFRESVFNEYELTFSHEIVPGSLQYSSRVPSLRTGPW